MNNLLFLTVAAALIATNIHAQLGSNIMGQEFSNLILLEGRHCADGLAFKLRKEIQCIELKERQEAECTEFASNLIKRVGNGKIAKADLDEAIELHKKHKAECRKLDASLYKEKVSIMDAHDEELDAFEKNPNVIPAIKISEIISKGIKAITGAIENLKIK